MSSSYFWPVFKLNCRTFFYSIDYYFLVSVKNIKIQQHLVERWLCMYIKLVTTFKVTSTTLHLYHQTVLFFENGSFGFWGGFKEGSSVIQLLLLLFRVYCVRSCTKVKYRQHNIDNSNCKRFFFVCVVGVNNVWWLHVRIEQKKNTLFSLVFFFYWVAFAHWPVFFVHLANTWGTNGEERKDRKKQQLFKKYI